MEREALDVSIAAHVSDSCEACLGFRVYALPVSTFSQHYNGIQIDNTISQHCHASSQHHRTIRQQDNTVSQQRWEARAPRRTSSRPAEEGSMFSNLVRFASMRSVPTELERSLVIDSGFVGDTREQKIAPESHLPRVIYPQVNSVY